MIFVKTQSSRCDLIKYRLGESEEGFNGKEGK
jgi:hypothetical protein